MMHLLVIILEKFSEALNEFRMNLDYFRSDTQYKTKQKKNSEIPWMDILSPVLL